MLLAIIDRKLKYFGEELIEINTFEANATLFHIGLATPISSIVQVVLCVSFMLCTAQAEKKQCFQQK